MRNKPDKISVSPADFLEMKERFFQANAHDIDAYAVTLAVLEDICGYLKSETRAWRGEIAIEVDWRKTDE